MAPFSPFPCDHPRGKNCGGAQRNRLCTTPPLYCPVDSARHAPGTVRGYRLSGFYAETTMSMNALNRWSLLWLNLVGARSSRAVRGRDGPCTDLVLLFARFLARPLPGQRSFHTLLLAGLQVKGVAFHFLDNVFLLHLALKTAQSVLEGFTLLQPNFCQTYTPPNPSSRTE